jgi:hypothetical protein
MFAGLPGEFAEPGAYGDQSRLHHSPRLFHSPQFFDAEMAISEDLVHQSGPQRFARVYRDDGTPAICVAKKVMATFGCDQPESRPSPRRRSKSEPVILGFRLMLRW